MTTLFDPGRHEALDGSAWNAARVRAGIADIVRDIEDSRGGGGQWPVHPLDDEGDEPPRGFKGIYLGGAGVLWALDWLRREGAVTLRGEPRDEIAGVHAAYLSDPDGGAVQPAFMVGEAGILLVAWRLTGADAWADRLHDVVQSNIAHPSNESQLGAPGTMLAAWHLWRATGAARWRELFIENVEQVWRCWTWDEAAQCHLWTQQLYGATVQYLGAGHGWAGNVLPLLKGAAVLGADRVAALHARCAQALGRLARRDGDAVNWPVATATPRPGRPVAVMQWCHGAPGIVSALADLPPGQVPELDVLLLAAGHAIWRAGPLPKGAGLCHGTAGNGHALLTLYRRTGDALWLERARCFAMHAIAQCEDARRQHGRGWYTLWTGDAGLAVHLWQCLHARPGLPLLDIV